ncbi:Crp/Fnr family transcriptional regulator [Algoriphagus sp.]|uniref:Crp/Fnr family transcriptional regulator n=1 Tax=Algoriphagus sp. TaxID=1872435 RepID=UPI00391B6198
MKNNTYFHIISKYFSTIPDAKGIEYLEDCLEETTFKKGESPIQFSKYHNFAYIIIHGAARSYCIKKDKEFNLWFAFENDTVASIQNYNGKPAKETVTFLEVTHCLKIDLPKLLLYSKTDFICSNFIRALLEDYIDFLETRLGIFQFHEGLERYLHILENEPALIQRIPLTYLASYLGISRETLSRLRAKAAL